ncbi:hypothetical protein Nepgr_013254 [Nepenthes gracilis]|uniref:Uncharacterized protein n=1 Tax=Nepenthes gracilis TaxID=150966 RepID=A0AAD3XNU1_NEPGR|nr:hypothetical protein Nepgr_013254 [Nepenthes gracilis]
MELQKAVKDPLSEALLMAETVSTGMGRDDMDNPTARTYLCDESIENSASGSGSRPHLPSPKTGNVGPLKNYKDAKFMRKRKRWSPLEEDTLLLGVQKFGQINSDGCAFSLIIKVMLCMHTHLLVATRCEIEQ